MTSDQLTAGEKAASPFASGFWDSHGWGFGLSVITRRDGVGPTPGSFGWDGGFHTSCYVDPRETRPYLCQFIDAAQTRLATQLGPKYKSGVRP